MYVGRDFGGVAYDITPESRRDVRGWHRRRQSMVPRTRHRGGPLAPALILHSAVYQTLGWYLPNIYGNLPRAPGMELLFAPVMVGERLTTRAVIVDRYVKRDREYVVNEVNRRQRGGTNRLAQPHPSELPAPRKKRSKALWLNKSREKDSSRSFKIGERGGDPIDLPMRRINEEMCMAFSGPARNYHNESRRRSSWDSPRLSCRGCSRCASWLR